MKHYSATAVERAMKVHEVIMRAMSKEIAWFQAAEIIGISCRQMQRWKRRWEKHGYEGLVDRRRGQPSPKRIARYRYYRRCCGFIVSSTLTSTCATFTRSWWKNTTSS